MLFLFEFDILGFWYDKRFLLFYPRNELKLRCPILYLVRVFFGISAQMQNKE